LQTWDSAESVVLADSLYWESSDFVEALENLHLKYELAIRSTNWRPLERIFSNGKQHKRFIRELIFGQRGRIRYYHFRTDPQTLPPESTWYIMTNLVGNIRKTIGNTYGLCTWIEYGFNMRKMSWDGPIFVSPTMPRSSAGGNSCPVPIC
jgi:SRSO17 transposase